MPSKHDNNNFMPSAHKITPNHHSFTDKIVTIIRSLSYEDLNGLGSLKSKSPRYHARKKNVKNFERQAITKVGNKTVLYDKKPAVL